MGCEGGRACPGKAHRSRIGMRCRRVFYTKITIPTIPGQKQVIDQKQTESTFPQGSTDTAA